ncbi:MAG: [LysW]-lysine hydrolase [Anaerolineae bacterium]|nr:[LysW]-lysine hydrolase [Anaerolineae bacterium]
MSELLTELVRRYSPSTYEQEAVSYLVDWMNDHDFMAQMDASGSAVGIIGDSNAEHTLMLLGHIDTFPGDLPVEMRDGVLYGRGSVDAKGSLCAFTEAAALSQIPAGWRVVVAGAVEEECATSKGARHLRKQFMPDLCIIGEPSGSGRITLGYKGRLVLEYKLTRPVAHTARPEPSAGALGAAFWARVEAWTQERNQGLTAAFEQVLAHLRAINTETDYLTETVRVALSLRLPPTCPPEEALSVLESLADEGAELRAHGLERAYQGSRNNALVRGMLAAIRENTGERPGFVLKSGTSDMNVVGEVWNCPIIAYGPGDSNLDHTPDEHLPLDEYQRAVMVLRRFIERLNET